MLVYSGLICQPSLPNINNLIQLKKKNTLSSFPNCAVLSFVPPFSHQL